MNSQFGEADTCKMYSDIGNGDMFLLRT